MRMSGCTLAFPTNGTLLAEHAARIVDEPPNCVWVSVDGPEAINDAQRGRGVFKRAMRGLQAIVAEKIRRGVELPELGVTCVITPANHLHIAELVLETLDLSQLRHLSLELQSFATEAQHREYARMLRADYGIGAAPYARAYVRDPALFTLMDRAAIVQQIDQIRAECTRRGIRLFTQPKTISVENVDRYLRGEWAAMVDKRSRCAVPWTYAEVSARGDVTTCHTFYDLPLGNVNERPLLDIWRGDRAQRLRAQLRDGLLPICTACCRYYQ
jgi:radical SAM protein with 4Fe4S-binding SPASM domain